MAIGSGITFPAGTEIRLRAEERLLAERFQDSYGAYRSPGTEINQWGGSGLRGILSSRMAIW